MLTDSVQIPTIVEDAEDRKALSSLIRSLWDVDVASGQLLDDQQRCAKWAELWMAHLFGDTLLVDQVWSGGDGNSSDPQSVDDPKNVMRTMTVDMVRGAKRYVVADAVSLPNDSPMTGGGDTVGNTSKWYSFNFRSKSKSAGAPEKNTLNVSDGMGSSKVVADKETVDIKASFINRIWAGERRGIFYVEHIHCSMLRMFGCSSREAMYSF